MCVASVCCVMLPVNCCKPDIVMLGGRKQLSAEWQKTGVWSPQTGWHSQSTITLEHSYGPIGHTGNIQHRMKSNWWSLCQWLILLLVEIVILVLVSNYELLQVIELVIVIKSCHLPSSHCPRYVLEPNLVDFWQCIFYQFWLKYSNCQIWLISVRFSY